MATRLKVTYTDGREFTVIASPRAQVMTERNFAGINDANNLQASYYLAWSSLFWGGKESADFETWLDTISDVERVEDEKADPTQVGQPPTSSSD